MMRAFFAAFFILIGGFASAQTIASKTEAGFSFCLSCIDNKGFIPLDASQMQQLNAVMKNEEKKEKPAPVFIGPRLDESKPMTFKIASFDKETEQERLKRSQQIPKLDDKRHLPTIYKPRKLKYVYVFDNKDDSLNFGFNRNSGNGDTSILQDLPRTQRNSKFLGLKYKKQFVGFK